MTKKELLAEMGEIQKQLNKMQEVVNVKESLERNISGFTAKDVAVRYGDPDGCDERLWYGFYIKYKGKLYDFYYGKSDGGAGDWWPKSEDDEYNCGAFNDFIPPGFSEACENSYEFRGTMEQAVARLNKYGITDIEKAIW